MAPSCPQCHSYKWLTSPSINEAFRDSLAKFKDIVCENCGWVGEADELGDAEEDGPET